LNRDIRGRRGFAVLLSFQFFIMFFKEVSGDKEFLRVFPVEEVPEGF